MMKKVTAFVLTLCLVLSGAFCYAQCVAGTENMKGNDGIPIELIEKSTYTSSEKGNSILASIDGHWLTIVFTENLGQVEIAITTSAGVPVETLA